MKEPIVRVALIVWTEPEAMEELEERTGKRVWRPSLVATRLGEMPVATLIPSDPHYGGFALGAGFAATAALGAAAIVEGLAIVRALTSVSRWFEGSGRESKED